MNHVLLIKYTFITALWILIFDLDPTFANPSPWKEIHPKKIVCATEPLSSGDIKTRQEFSIQRQLSGNYELKGYMGISNGSEWATLLEWHSLNSHCTFHSTQLLAFRCLSRQEDGRTDSDWGVQLQSKSILENLEEKRSSSVVIRSTHMDPRMRARGFSFYEEDCLIED